jgi:prepilin signal peptidase PulO-like enzyme (type II secretory pathway)
MPLLLPERSIILSLTKSYAVCLYRLMTEIIPVLASFFVGTFFGSFFYTLALRYASGEIQKKTLPALFSRSRCPACKNAIHPLYLVPLFGYLALKGRCGKCGAKISYAYPLWEILYGSLSALFAWKFGITAYCLAVYLLAGTAICISIVDVKTLTIPDSLVIVMTVLSIYPIVINCDIKDNIFGLLTLFAVFVIILLVFPGSFGAGDLKLASTIGLVSGFELSIMILEISLVTGAVTGIFYALITQQSLKTKIPFAPFLAAGLIVSLVYGRELLLVYYRIFS